MYQITSEQKALLAARIQHLMQAQSALQDKLQQQQAAAEAANTEMFLELLGVVDALEHLCKYLGENPDPPANFHKRLPKTLQSILYKLEQALAQQGVQEISIPLNEPADFRLCKAIDQVPAANLPPNTVTTVSRRGFYQQERILRPAEVSIAHPADS
jgi:molecular chaperone GrpE (heat shock protein)